MKKCRITVMRITEYPDLMESYEYPQENACDMHVGQVYIADGWKKPAGLRECEARSNHGLVCTVMPVKHTWGFTIQAGLSGLVNGRTCAHRHLDTGDANPYEQVGRRKAEKPGMRIPAGTRGLYSMLEPQNLRHGGLMGGYDEKEKILDYLGKHKTHASLAFISGF